MGGGEYAVTVPSMDGALRPNTRLDDSDVLYSIKDVDNLAVANGVNYLSSGKKLLSFRSVIDELELVCEYSSAISAIATDGSGMLAIGLDSGGVILRQEKDGAERTVAGFAGSQLESVTSLAFDRTGVLYLCLGSTHNRATAWKRDLMSLGSSGSVWKIRANVSGAECLGDGLAFPFGISFDAENVPIVSEAWKHRLIRWAGNGRWVPVLNDLPGYPARLAPASGGGFWLSIFAPRSQMIEFVLRERIYRERMLDEIDEQFWMAPDLRAGRSFKEPLQGGGVKHLGIHKPWGPTRSYGLVVRLDERFQPVASMHSRSDGNRHGVTSCIETDGLLLVACKGDGFLISPWINVDANLS